MLSNRTVVITPPKCIIIMNKKVLENYNGTILTISYAINVLLVITLNIMLIIGLLKTKKKTLSRSSKLFVFLCCSDLLVGLVLMPLQISHIYVNNMNCLENAARAFWNPFPLILSGVHITLISLDRYLMIVRNNFYQKYFTDKVVIIAIIIEVGISFIWGLSYSLATQGTDLSRAAKYFLSLATFNVFILLTALTLNILIRRNVHQQIGQTSTLTNRNRQHDRRLSNTIMLITISLCVFYLPSVTALFVTGSLMLTTTNREHLRYAAIALIWTLFLTAVNSAVNSAIYIITNSRVHEYYRTLFMGSKYDTEYDRAISHSSKENVRVDTLNRNTGNKGLTTVTINGDVNDKNIAV